MIQGHMVRQRVCVESYENCLHGKGELTHTSCLCWIHWLIY